MTNISNETRKKSNPSELSKTKRSCEKLTVLTSRSNITTTTQLAVLSIHFSHIGIQGFDDEQLQAQSGQFVYICAGSDSRKSPKKVDGLLLNVIDHGSTPRRVENAMEMRRRTDPEYVMLDSSGYQILQAERKGETITFDPNLPIRNNKKSLNITPRHVMQIALLHDADSVVGLDWPILKKKTADEREKEFLTKKPYNVQWAFESYEWKNKLVPHLQYFQPLQGYTIEHHNIFLDEIKDVLFDGICMPIRNASIFELAMFLVNLYQRGIRRVHLLGTSKFSVIALCAYVARNMFHFISIDSTSWRVTAGFHEFYYPTDLLTIPLGKKFNPNAVVENPCKCQFCGGRSFQDIHNIEPPKAKVQLLLQHNYLVIENLVKDLFAKGDNIGVLGQELMDRCRTAYRRREVKNLIRVLSIVDSFKDGDIKVLQDLLNKGNRKRR